MYLFARSAATMFSDMLAVTSDMLGHVGDYAWSAF